jgi:hypothetical protein
MKWTRAAHARNLLGPLIRSTYRINAVNCDRIPSRDGLLMVCDWNNIATPAVLKAAAPRPVHVWASGAAALPGPLLTVTGDLGMPLAGAGVGVVRTVVDLLRDGQAVVAVGVEDVGYVLAATLVPVLAVHITAPPTKRATDPPARKSRIGVTFGELHHLPERLSQSLPHPSLPTRATVRSMHEWARQVIADDQPLGGVEAIA